MVVVGIASVFRSVIGGPLLMERTSAEARAHFFSLNFAMASYISLRKVDFLGGWCIIVK